MINTEKLLRFLEQSIEILFERGHFVNGEAFKSTQREAIEAYCAWFRRTDLSDKDKLVGFFRMPTGTGKTAVFLSTLNEAHQLAEVAGEELKSVIVVPRLNLLRQTKRELKKYAPYLAERIGLYGGRYKQLGHSLTIMTYEAWVALTETGKLNSNHVHMLISDEGHRGTSERRVDNIFSFFDGVTARLSFTATAKFDETKSVAGSHHREIYGRDIRPAIEDGDLAAYAQTQAYTIRVKPPEDADGKEIEEDNEFFFKLRKAAWTKRVVAILRDGIDEQTGSPLSDAISGFYCADVKHALQTEKELNADSVLVKKAEKMGFDGVAIAIHGYMSEKEQNRRLDAFLAGRYMVVVGDEMLKEGLDYPPLKNIFDWQRGSAVDKAQIIGRAVRQYWDKLKRRWSGATIIDTIVYVGSNDPKVDKKRRDSARALSVRAWDIIDGTAVFAPGVKPRPPGLIPTPSGKSGSPISIDGQEVEAATTLDEVNIVKAETDKLKTAYVDLNEPLEDGRTRYEHLLEERDRTGLYANAIFRLMGDRVPKGLSAQIISSWILGNTVRALAEHLIIVMNTYASQKDTSRIDLHKKDETGESPYSKLLAEKERTGLGSHAIFQKMKLPPTSSLTPDRIETWFSGVQSAQAEDFQAVIDAYAEEKDGKKVNLQKKDETGRSLYDKLLAEEERTGLEAAEIFEKIKQPVPKGLSARLINDWLKGRTQSARADCVNVVLLTYADQKDNPRVYVDLYKKNKKTGQSPFEELWEERKRTGLGSHAIFSKVESPVPEGLSGDKIYRWFGGNKKTAREDHLQAVMKAYKAIKTEGPIPKTPAVKIKASRASKNEKS